MAVIGKNSGSAKILAGETYVLTIFISETRWDVAEKRGLYDQVYEAERWLIAQAKRYNRTISFKHGCFGLNDDIIIRNIPTGIGSPAASTIVPNVLKVLGYPNSYSFVQWVEKNTQADNAVVLIFANKTGRGFAIPFNDNNNKALFYLEGTLMFKTVQTSSTGKAYRMPSATIAHEMLHLFGAWDLYLRKNASELAKKIYPNDIMLRLSPRINELVIDKVTAWRVGLSNYYDKSFEYFNPANP